MLSRYIAYLRQPKQLVSMPFRVVALATGIYLLISRPGWDSEQEHVAAIIIFAMVAATFVIDIAWWAARQYRERRTGRLTRP